MTFVAHLHRSAGSIDWGSVPEWVTAGLAALAAGVALWALRYNKKANDLAAVAADAATESNELTATAYRDDVRVRDEAQARLVYSTVVQVQEIRAGERFQSSRDESGDWSRAYFSSIASPDPNDPHAALANRDAQLVIVQIHNSSPEIIGPFQIGLYDRTSRLLIPDSTGRGVLLPGQTEELQIAIERTERSRFVPDISFRDSAGKWWTRREFDPVKPLDDARRERYESMFE